MNILFICKHNIFRSRVAQTYFNKINKNSNIKATSAGIIPGTGITSSQQVIVKAQEKTAKKFGIEYKRNPRGLNVEILKKQDLIVLVCDDIPIKIFNNKDYIKKIVQWKIPDVVNNNPTAMEKTIKMIIQKVDKLNKDLK